MSWRRYIAALVLALAVSACAVSVLDQDLDARYDQAVKWIEDNSVIRNGDRPAVFVTTQSELKRVAKVAPGLRVAAAYFPWIHAIAFARDFNPDSIKDRGIAIHEIVHAMRRFMVFECKEAREKEAYFMQELFYIKNGTSILIEIGLTFSQVQKLTECDQ